MSKQTDDYERLLEWAINEAGPLSIEQVFINRIVELEEKIRQVNQERDSFQRVGIATMADLMKEQDRNAKLREAVYVYLNLEDCANLEQLEALLEETST